MVEVLARIVEVGGGEEKEEEEEEEAEGGGGSYKIYTWRCGEKRIAVEVFLLIHKVYM